VSTYTASVRVDDGMLHTSRPLTAPEKVGDVIDAIVYDLRDGDSPIVSVELIVETSDESQTPIGDSVQGTSSTPIDTTPPEPEPDPAGSEVATSAVPQ
jgi:hypothetical protein